MITVGIHIQGMELSMLYTMCLSALALVVWKCFDIVKLIMKYIFIKAVASFFCYKPVMATIRSQLGNADSADISWQKTMITFRGTASSWSWLNVIASFGLQLIMFWYSDLPFWNVVILQVFDCIAMILVMTTATKSHFEEGNTGGPVAKQKQQSKPPATYDIKHPAKQKETWHLEKSDKSPVAKQKQQSKPTATEHSAKQKETWHFEKSDEGPVAKQKQQSKPTATYDTEHPAKQKETWHFEKSDKGPVAKQKQQSKPTATYDTEHSAKQKETWHFEKSDEVPVAKQKQQSKPTATYDTEHPAKQKETWHFEKSNKGPVAKQKQQSKPTATYDTEHPVKQKETWHFEKNDKGPGAKQKQQSKPTATYDIKHPAKQKETVIHTNSNRQGYPQLLIILPRRLSFAERRMMDIKWYLNYINLMSSYLERDAQGWLIPKATLNTHLDIAKLIGFTIDWSKGCPRVIIYYEPSDNGNGLLSTADLQTLLQIDAEEIKRITFSLDDVVEVCPVHFTPRTIDTLYQKRCAPRKLANSGIIDTLFHADYLLKFFAIGSEVSAKFPFPVRSVRHLISSLPKELQHALRPCHERGAEIFACKHRLWIEVERLNFQSHVTDRKEFYFIESVKTKVNAESTCAHPTDKGCKEFAEDFTSHYSEISQHLPIFARVVELAKLQYIVRTIHDRLATKRYKVTLQASNEQSQGSSITSQHDFAPSSVSETSFGVSGGVQMFPSYTKYPGTPPVHDISAYTHENGVTGTINVAKHAREGGIRLETASNFDTASDSSMLPLKFEQVGLNFLELAAIATIVEQKST